MIKDAIKRILRLSPVPLSKNHRYDLLTKKIISSLPDSANCIDVGCYKGEILDLMNKVAPKGRHYGIEPVPGQFEFLNKKYSNKENCSILNIAASNTSGVSGFNYVISNPAYSGLKKRDYDRANEKDTTIEVRTELLDNVIPSDRPIDLIKIDVEGAELLVLEGAVNMIKKNKPIIIFEHGLGASNHYGSTPAKLFDFFKEIPLSISTLDDYLRNKKTLTKEEFEKQYYEKLNYYFIAHSCN